MERGRPERIVRVHRKEKSMVTRVIGLYNIRDRIWDKMAYLHAGSSGETFVNGERMEIVLHRAGTPFSADAEYALVLPGDITLDKERYLAVNGGECLVWLAEDSSLSLRTPGFVGVSARVEFWREIRAGVLTISDKGSRGERIDTAGPLLCDMMEALGSKIVIRETIPDERLTIGERLKRWSDEEGLQIILTTGGTGISQRDVTPEAMMDIADRVIPGFGEWMRSHSMLYTPRGFLSRGLAVIRGRTLIIAFPGSERAVRQCFEAVMPALRHGIDMLNAWDSECGVPLSGRS